MNANIFIILLKYIAISVFIFIIIILVLINLYPLLFYKSPVTKLKRDRFDVIIILGFPALQDGKPSPIMRERVIKTVELFNKGYANNIICSGGGVYNKYIEADVMANFAESLGIPNSCLIKEDKSRNTYQNIQNSIKIMEDKKILILYCFTFFLYTALSKEITSFVIPEKHVLTNMNVLEHDCIKVWCKNYYLYNWKEAKMVILIGGVSCTGKTVMAQKLLEKYKIPYLSIDHVKMGLIRGNKYCDFSATDSDDEITKKIWPLVKGIIMTNIENGQNIIIEGCYLPPEHIWDFEPKYLEQIIPLYIGFSKNYLEKHFISGIIEHISEIEQKDCDDYMNRDNFIKLHTQLKEFCRMNNAKFFEINDDYEGEMNNVYKWIDEQVEAKW